MFGHGEKKIKIATSKAPKLNCEMERGDWHEIQQSMVKETSSKAIWVWKDQSIKSLLHEMCSLVIDTMFNTMNKYFSTEKICSD